MFVSCVCCVLSGRGLVQRSPTDCGASLCVIKKPRERGGHTQRWAAEPDLKKFSSYICSFAVLSTETRRRVEERRFSSTYS
jgi:hypothetical protein